MMPFNGYGSYLIRESEINSGDYSLSVRDTDRVRHYKINKLPNGTFFITRHVTFKTLQDLVAYYQQQADGLCINLIKPCAFSEEPQTAHLSKQAGDEWEINRRHIRFVKKLYNYMFFELWEGLWNETTPIAIKTLKPGEKAINDFLQTANLMKKMQHQNVIQLYGVCTKEEPVYIVTEFMKHNRLLEYLRGDGRSSKLPQLIDMASQVAAGMAYLEEQNIIHRDLAARNILVGEKLICKVANFEMARILDHDGIYEAPSGTKFPIKWTAPEAAMYNKFSIKSDVWSFGIVLYEIITYGRFPYPGMLNAEVLERLQQGYRMPRRPECPEKLYNIMLACWQEDPVNRPMFETLQRLLEEFFTSPSRQAFEEWEIDRRTIVLVRNLMSTDIFEVWEGLLNETIPIAVKTPKPGKIAIVDFLQTANLMKKMQHQNIIQLYGVCTKKEPVYIVTEFMKHNTLLEYLCGEGRSLKLPQLIDMASQVAAGMAYLEEQNIVHRDLSAKNILIGEGLICKVANFELASQTSEGIYMAKEGDKFAIKWTAPEAALGMNRFSIKSDVWSFGILLYELITYGHPPYPDMSNDLVLKKLQQAYRMPRPTECPDKLYNIMLDCWQEETTNRPTFDTLQQKLEGFSYQ